MSFHEAYPALRKIDGKVTETESQWLWEHAASLRPGSCILEIGVWHGRSTLTMALANPSAYVVGIEPDIDRAKMAFGHAMNGMGLDSRLDLELGPMYSNPDRGTRVHFINEPSPEALKRFNDSYFDMVFIDGNHTAGQVTMDIIESIRVLRRGGILCGHDYKILSVRVMVDLMLFCADPGCFSHLHRGAVGSIWCATMEDKPFYDDVTVEDMQYRYNEGRLGGFAVGDCLKRMRDKVTG